jgi:hypothetical protein
VPGVLRDVIFKGPTADYLARLDNGVELTITDAVSMPRIQRDDPVYVVWAPEAGQSFPAVG